MSRGQNLTRSYTHLRCKESTEVTGNGLLVLSDPFSACVRTYCDSCDEMFPLNEFAWDDTGEKISSARRRLASKAPPWVRRLLRPAGCWTVLAVGGVIGVLAGAVLGQAAGGWGVPLALLLGLIGAGGAVVILGAFVAPALTAKYYGNKNWRFIR